MLAKIKGCSNPICCTSPIPKYLKILARQIAVTSCHDYPLGSLHQLPIE
jgi:hypothetical protein